MRRAPLGGPRADASRPRSRRARCGRSTRPSTRSVPRISTGETRKCRTIRRGAPLGRALRRTRAGARGCGHGCDWGSAATSAWLERVEDQLGRVDDDVDARQLAELLQLLVGEGRLGRAAAAEHVDLADAARPRARPARARRCRWPPAPRGCSPGCAPGPSPRCRCRPRRRVSDARSKLRLRKSGWALYQPTNSVAEWLPGRCSRGIAHAPVGPRADRVDDRVVVGRQVGVGQVAAHLDVAVEAELGVGGDLVVDPGDRLDLLVVGRDPAAHQAEGRRQPVVHVDLDLQVVLLLEMLGGVEARRARADDGHPQRGRPACRDSPASISPRSVSAVDGGRSGQPRLSARARQPPQLKCGRGHASGSRSSRSRAPPGAGCGRHAGDRPPPGCPLSLPR